MNSLEERAEQRLGRVVFEFGVRTYALQQVVLTVLRSSVSAMTIENTV